MSCSDWKAGSIQQLYTSEVKARGFLFNHFSDECRRHDHFQPGLECPSASLHLSMRSFVAFAPLVECRDATNPAVGVSTRDRSN